MSSAGTTAAVLAHQGGWDELLLVLAPLVLFGFLLLLAKRRADQMTADTESDTEGDTDAEQAVSSNGDTGPGGAS